MAGDSNQIFRIEYIDEASRQPCCPRRTGSLLLAASVKWLWPLITSAYTASAFTGAIIARRFNLP